MSINFKDIPQFPKSDYQIDAEWGYIEKLLEDWSEPPGLDLNPDFQRAHVWTIEQQIVYVEYVLQGGEVGRNIIFNHDGKDHEWGHIQLVDGKQRLESVRMFMRNELPVFGQLYSEFTGRMRRHQNSFKFKVCNLQSRGEILHLYLNINAGGTPHTQAELDGVRQLLKESRSI